MSSLILLGAGLTAVGVAGRFLIRKGAGGAFGSGMSMVYSYLCAFYDVFLASFFNRKVFQAYKGGFEKQMSKSEACKILSVPMTSTPKQIREHHRRLMIANHPDKGGSPYIASKINEAKDLLDAKKR